MFSVMIRWKQCGRIWIVKMREVVLTSSFKQDYKRLKRSSGQHEMLQLQAITTQLANDEILPEKHRDHALAGNWNNHRECHIKPD